MSQKQEQYTKIITDEDNKKWFASLTEQEQTDLKLNTSRKSIINPVLINYE